MPRDRIARVSQGFAQMSVRHVLLTVIVLALPALGYVQAAPDPASAPAKEAPQTPEPAAQPRPAETPPASIIEPQALDRLKRMSGTLARLKR